MLTRATRVQVQVGSPPVHRRARSFVRCGRGGLLEALLEKHLGDIRQPGTIFALSSVARHGAAPRGAEGVPAPTRPSPPAHGRRQGAHAEDHQALDDADGARRGPTRDWAAPRPAAHGSAPTWRTTGVPARTIPALARHAALKTTELLPPQLAVGRAARGRHAREEPRARRRARRRRANRREAEVAGDGRRPPRRAPVTPPAFGSTTHRCCGRTAVAIHSSSRDGERSAARGTEWCSPSLSASFASDIVTHPQISASTGTYVS